MRLESNASNEPGAIPYGDTVAGMRAVIGRHLRDCSPDEDLRRALGPVVRAARARGLERDLLILAAKTVWFALPEVREPSIGDQAREGQIERIISACVEEYDSG